VYEEKTLLLIVDKGKIKFLEAFLHSGKKKLFSLKLVLVEERKHVTVELQSKKNIKMKESYQSSKD
jgi:hypothetical protein